MIRGIPPEVLKTISAAAAADGRSRNGYLLRFLTQHFELGPAEPEPITAIAPSEKDRTATLNTHPTNQPTGESK